MAGVGPAGELLVKVRAAPTDGAANHALIRTIAANLDVAPSAISIRHGAAGRRKVLRIEEASASALRERWPGLAVSD